MVFRANSSAGSATFTIEGARNGFASGGLAFFRDAASAGDATINLKAAAPGISFGSGGGATFVGDSTAGNATITTEQGTNFRLTGNADLGTARVTVVGNANANNASGTVMTFGDSASAANGTIKGAGRDRRRILRGGGHLRQ